MFKNLPSSGGKKRRTWTPSTAFASLVLHGLMLAGALYATTQAPAAAKKAEELVEFMDIQEAEPEPEPEPEPEEPPPPPDPVETPPPPKGFQTLEPPSEPPPVIPEVDTSAPPVSAEDFSGIGVAGGTSKGVAGGTPQAVAKEEPKGEGFAYEVAVLERKPELTNKSQVASLMQRLYPRMLQDAGIGGTVMMQFVIQADGKVDPASVKVIDSTHEQFGEASVKAVEKFRFRPGRYKGQNVRVLIQMPITWQPER